DGLQDAAHERDLAQHTAEALRYVDQAEVAGLELLFAEHHDPAGPLEEAVPIEAVVRLRHTPTLGARAERRLGALAAAREEAEATRVARLGGRGRHVLVDDPHRVRIESEVELGQILVVVILEKAEANDVLLRRKEHDHVEERLEAIERRRQI